MCHYVAMEIAPKGKEEEMFRFEFLVLVADEKEVVSVESTDWNSARELVSGLEVVKSLRSIDLSPQKFLAW